MEFKYSWKRRSYKLNFYCSEPESCNCNEKIIELFNNNSKYLMDTLRVIGLAHIQYEKIKDKIKHKVYVTNLYIWPSEMYNAQEILDLAVLDLLFYSDEIEALSVEYNQKLEFGNVSLKNLKNLSINRYYGKILPLSSILPHIINCCPNVKELELERKFCPKELEREVESLEFIIKNLITLNKNLVITLNYINDYGYKEDDKKYITENNLKKLDKKTVIYELPNIDEEIYIDLYEVSYGP